MSYNTILIKNALILSPNTNFEEKQSLLIKDDVIAEIASEIDESGADKIIDADGKTISEKNKSWAGYLNDAQKNKYGKGLENNASYSNLLVAGNTYTTTLNNNNVAKVIVTVTTNNDEVKTIPLEK